MKKITLPFSAFMMSLSASFTASAKPNARYRKIVAEDEITPSPKTIKRRNVQKRSAEEETKRANIRYIFWRYASMQLFRARTVARYTELAKHTADHGDGHSDGRM